MPCRYTPRRRASRSRVPRCSVRAERDCPGEHVADEPYVPLLPLVVYAIIAANHGVFWAALGALTAAVVLLVSPRRTEVGLSNFLMRGAVLWFTVVTVAGAIVTAESSWVQRDALALAFSGFAVIALASLASTPFTEYWTRMNAPPRHWTRAPFRHANVLTTMLWGATFAAIATSTLVASTINTAAASTIFNWLLPLAVVLAAVLRTRSIWDDFVDEAMDEALGREPLWDVGPQPRDGPTTE